MKVSIITVCYNSEKFIKSAIQSVNNQKYSDIEHIFIDGKSDDSTVSLIKKLSHRQNHIISEPDKGIYDAMNKGLVACSGDVICFLNSDDVYDNTDVIADIVEIFEQKNTRIVWGDLVYVRQDDIRFTSRLWRSKIICERDLRSGIIPPHPSFFIARTLVQDVGPFDLAMPLAADFDYMKRCLVLDNFDAVHFPKVLVRMRLGGATNASIRNVLQQNYEILQSLRQSFSKFSLTRFICVKFMSKALEYMNAKLPR